MAQQPQAVARLSPLSNRRHSQRRFQRGRALPAVLHQPVIAPHVKPAIDAALHALPRQRAKRLHLIGNAALESHIAHVDERPAELQALQQDRLDLGARCAGSGPQCRIIAAAQSKVLTPSTQGPGFTGDGKTARHQDVITIRNQRKKERPLHSQTLQPDGVLETLHDRNLPMARDASAFSAPQMLLFQ